MPTSHIRLGQAIRRLRESHGWSQEQFARELGCSANTLGRWERGERVPNAYDVVDLATALQVSTCAILGDANAIEQARPRLGPVYYVNRAALKALEHAKTPRAFRHALRSHPNPTCVVYPDDEVVSEEEWRAARERIRTMEDRFSVAGE